MYIYEFVASAVDADDETGGFVYIIADSKDDAIELLQSEILNAYDSMDDFYETAPQHTLDNYNDLFNLTGKQYPVKSGVKIWGEHIRFIHGM